MLLWCLPSLQSLMSFSLCLCLIYKTISQVCHIPRVIVSHIPFKGSIDRSHNLSSSLANGTVPYCFKLAIIQRLIKKPNLDKSDLNNFWPISILVQIVYTQLLSYFTV